MSSETEDEKLFNDPIHGHIELHPLLVKIIDTPEFQRLRHIKQLGGTYYVYPGGCHNRFEHSIGVCYLAGKMVERLRKKQPELGITDQEVLCVKIAGLCHDLGHGPFSHLFENLFIPEVLHGAQHEKREEGTQHEKREEGAQHEKQEEGAQHEKWEHESASVKMFHHMLKENPKVKKKLEDKGLNSDEQTFIEELIKGEPDKKNPLPEERWTKKRFLYEIVANKKYGIDVDRWDYFARDSHSMGIPSNFDMRRTMHLARVLKCRRMEVGHHKCLEGTTHICMRDNEVYNLYEMFHTRYSLYKRAYQHKVVKGVELMITDALVAANDHLRFCGKKMSEAMDDMDAYIQLTDEVFQQILRSTETQKMEKARDILKRLQTRKLYRCIIDESCDDWKKDHVLTGQQIRDKMATPGTELHENIHVLVVPLSYGMKPDNRMLFYKKENPNKAVLIPKEEVSLLLPETFEEHYIRVYVKKRNQPDLEQAAKDCFQNWWEKQPKEKDQGLKEENRKLKEEVKILRQQLEDKEQIGSPDGNGQQESESVQANKS